MSMTKKTDSYHQQWYKIIHSIIPPGPFCRDCADGNGTCDSDGLPCEPTDRAIEIFNRLKAECAAKDQRIKELEEELQKTKNLLDMAINDLEKQHP
jgi:hypothetical protein